jgi:hypothetical protein
VNPLPASVARLTGVVVGLLALILVLHVGTQRPAQAAAANPSPLALAPLPPAAGGPIDFARDIQPLLEQHCHSCHGAKKQRAGLRLDRKADALTGGDSGRVIIAGNSAESLLIHNVSGVDPDMIMPPEDDPLTPEQIGKLRAWIDAGAIWPEGDDLDGGQRSDHWAFQPPQRGPLPAVQNPGWVRNPIDAFVLARLEAERIAPAPEADRVTLIRRLSLDLTGLPPEPEETAAFVRDTRPDAYERAVDRLLASPHFGERWGRHWLDLARYADSDGYEKDSPRPYAYLFRDWVIEAVNRDVPFDQFTIEQLAGDLLPGATHEQKVATGFHRQTLTNREGGVDREEFRTKATVDRVSTTGSVWLGLTVGCAECHTHKYDPITQREFYQLYSFFNDASEQEIPAAPPSELAEYTRRLKNWEEKRAELEPALQARSTELAGAGLAAWEGSLTLPAARWAVLRPAKVAIAAEGDETPLTAARDGSISPRPRDTVGARILVEATTNLKRVTGFRLEVMDEPGRTVGRGRGGDFSLSEFIATVQSGDGEPRRIAFAAAQADFSAEGADAMHAIDGRAETGWRVAPQTSQPHVIVFTAREPVELPEGAKLHFEIEQASVGLINRFRLSATGSRPPLEPSTIPDAIVAVLRTPADQRTEKQRKDLAGYHAGHVDPEGRRLRLALAAHEGRKPKEPGIVAAVMTAEERKTHVHIRGDFLRPGDEVQPGTPAVLHPFTPRGPRGDRLDLAQWLLDPANPLTPRVAVNHVWKHLFGRALVGSVDDFGTRGEPPSHPELLDWLALAFRTPTAGGASREAPGLGWSRKALIRLIVTSSTYRQSSRIRPELLPRDPGNLLLARQNRFRLEAEGVRDVFLAASGLLNRAIGGPSIRPQLPADIAALGYANSVKWQESQGAERHRRGLYIFFQRTVPYPMLMTFDAPDSNAACARRESSNTPLQALTLLNDPVFFECAQALGRRVAAGAGGTDEKIRSAFQLCLARAPDETEMAQLRRVHAGHLALLRANPESAAKIVGDSYAANAEEPAAFVALCRVIMNLDEFVTRE